MKCSLLMEYANYTKSLLNRILHLLLVCEHPRRCNELAYRKSPNENPERRKSDFLMTETYIYATKMSPVFSNDFSLLNIVP